MKQNLNPEKVTSVVAIVNLIAKNAPELLPEVKKNINLTEEVIRSIKEVGYRNEKFQDTVWVSLVENLDDATLIEIIDVDLILNSSYELKIEEFFYNAVSTQKFAFASHLFDYVLNYNKNENIIYLDRMIDFALPSSYFFDEINYNKDEKTIKEIFKKNIDFFNTILEKITPLLNGNVKHYLFQDNNFQNKLFDNKYYINKKKNIFWNKYLTSCIKNDNVNLFELALSYKEPINLLSKKSNLMSYNIDKYINKTESSSVVELLLDCSSKKIYTLLKKEKYIDVDMFKSSELKDRNVFDNVINEVSNLFGDRYCTYEDKVIQKKVNKKIKETMNNSIYFYNQYYKAETNDKNYNDLFVSYLFENKKLLNSSLNIKALKFIEKFVGDKFSYKNNIYSIDELKYARKIKIEFNNDNKKKNEFLLEEIAYLTSNINKENIREKNIIEILRDDSISKTNFDIIINKNMLELGLEENKKQVTNRKLKL